MSFLIVKKKYVRSSKAHSCQLSPNLSSIYIFNEYEYDIKKVNCVLLILITRDNTIFRKLFNNPHPDGQALKVIKMQRTLHHITSTTYNLSIICDNIDKIEIVSESINSLRPSDAIWWHRSGSTLAHVMTCCLTAPRHYLSQYWLVISEAEWHSPECMSTRDIWANIH